MSSNDYSYEKLEYLRKNTKLNPKSYLEVTKKRLEADKFQKDYKKYEPNDQIGVDYTEANTLEFILRMQVWQNKLIKEWQQFGQNYTLEEYSLKNLNDLVNEERYQKR